VYSVSEVNVYLMKLLRNIEDFEYDRENQVRIFLEETVSILSLPGSAFEEVVKVLLGEPRESVFTRLSSNTDWYRFWNEQRINRALKRAGMNDEGLRFECVMFWVQREFICQEMCPDELEKLFFESPISRSASCQMMSAKQIEYLYERIKLACENVIDPYLELDSGSEKELEELQQAIKVLVLEFPEQGRLVGEYFEPADMSELRNIREDFDRGNYELIQDLKQYFE